LKHGINFSSVGSLAGILAYMNTQNMTNYIYENVKDKYAKALNIYEENMKKDQEGTLLIPLYKNKEL